MHIINPLVKWLFSVIPFMVNSALCGPTEHTASFSPERSITTAIETVFE